MPTENLKKLKNKKNKKQPPTTQRYELKAIGLILTYLSIDLFIYLSTYLAF